MMPAVAQVVAAVSALVELSDSARTNFFDVSAVSRVRKLRAKVSTVDQNTDSVGEKPHSMKKTIETSDAKWKPWRRIISHSVSSGLTDTIRAPKRLASSSTMNSSER